jgi:hypothetical protein
MSSDIANPRFPAGLRVLVVDDDPLCLRIVEKMLKRCQYEGAAKSFSFTRRSFLSCGEIGRGTRRKEARRTSAGPGRGAGKRGTRGDTVEAPVPTAQRARARSQRPPTAVPRPRNPRRPSFPSSSTGTVGPLGALWTSGVHFLFPTNFFCQHVGNDEMVFFRLRRHLADALPSHVPPSLPFTNSSDHLHARRGRAENPARA